MPDEQIILSHFYPALCPQCGGSGCAECDGFGLVYWYTDLDSATPQHYTLYWSKIIDWQHIAQRHLELIVTKALNFSLVIFGLLGLLLGAWLYGAAFWSGQVFAIHFSPFLWRWYGWSDSSGDIRAIIFWLSLLLDGYAYYRLERASTEEHAVLRRVFVEDVSGKHPDAVAPLTPAWAELNGPAAQLLDISLSFKPETIKAIEQAWRIAKNWHHAEVLPIHLLAGSFTNNRIAVIFSRLGTDWDKLAQGIKAALGKEANGSSDPALSAAVKNILFRAYEQAYLTRQSKVTVAELLIAIDQEKNLASELLYELAIEPDKIKNVVVWLQVNEQLRDQWQRYHRLGRRRPKGEVNKAYTAVMTPFLDAFATDLTRQAAYGMFPTNIAREREIEEIFRIIQGSSASVVLVGLPGVGKSAIIEEIAQRMIADEVPKILQDKRLLSLSVPKLTAGGTAAEGNERLLRIFDELERAGNVILVIENVADLVGISVGGEESLDLSSALSNYLAKTNSIAITTANPQEYSQMETVTSLGNYLHKVTVNEPKGNQAIQIVESRVGGIEYQNKVVFSYDAVAKAIELSGRYLHDRYLPAKAIELLKETAVDVAKKQGASGGLVSAEDVAVIISAKTNIPLTKISQRESEKLVNLEDEIHQRMVDQEEAVSEVADALRRARAGMRDPNRPIANFLFLGPTGVGKTELAKTIAAVYFGDEKNMIRLDMSEYQTKEGLYRLIGSPTDSQSRGYLTELARQNPFALLLFDEVEKAHPDILNLFLQVMDDGRLTDNLGRTVDFTNSIIIMTANAGTRFIQEQVKAGVELQQIKHELIENKLNEFFRPEVLNRFDAINVFKPLTMDDVLQITGLLVKKIADTLLGEGVALQVSPAVIAELAQLGFDPQFGARPLRRVIQDRLSNTLANMKIQNQYGRGDRIIVEPGGQTRVEKDVLNE
ncbi:ATP-dependent Clp protease ATP-binding subunit [Candidatus Falkowbacteria bacterium]|nr:ATP-dependent Clp protease ATP-binding subunit [Candidatus Falkowbacteria bacterium]